jgi:integrase
VLADDIDDRVGPVLREAFGVGGRDDPGVVRRKVADRLLVLAERLPADLGHAVRVALALGDSATDRFLKDRLSHIAETISRDPRTAKRRVEEGLRRLAEIIVDEAASASSAWSKFAPTGWYIASLHATLLLDRDPPQLLERRRIVATQAGLDEVVASLSAPPRRSEEGTPTIRLDMLHGGTVVAEETLPGGHYRGTIRLPAPLGIGQEHEYSVVFLAFDAGRLSTGRASRGRVISTRHHHRTVHDLRLFFDDLTAWDWADRPSGRLVHRSDSPRLPAPLPRALTPDVDTALMRAVGDLPDPVARCGIMLLRGAGLRLGELLDLELGCLWDLPGHGSWLKVPLGKLGTERVVPIDDPTLAALDAWMAVRGRQRALPHPRDSRPVDFLLAIGGQRIGGSRIRRGLAQAVALAGLTAPDGRPLHVTPHQLRHTYATSLVNAGMNLQALMALLGHVTPEMTLRYAALADDTVRDAYNAAMAKLRGRRELPLVIAGRPVVPDRISWLRAEMLKTRVAHGYCSRHLAADACPYANICEQCDNFTTTTEFLPQLQAQPADALALRDDAEARGWDTEVARHARVIASLQRHLDRLRQTATPTSTP